MTANELRIGNWVIIETQQTKVGILELNSIDDGYWSYVGGIPLTPEILEKAGFVKKDNGYWLGESYYFNGEKLYYFPLDCPNESYADELPPYLHWLQNHYYFSRVEELEIDL